MATEHDRVSEIFLAACRLPAAERAALLDERCGDDTDLRASVESLLEHHDRPAVSIDRPAFETPIDAEHFTDPPAPVDTGLPDSIGAYRPVRLLGEGGMGVVYLAEQDRPRRTVALKVLRTGMTSHSTLKRFTLEHEVLGRLQHPGIAQIFEAGVHEEPGGRQGQPFFAMEFVDGLPLTEYTAREQLGTRKRLGLLVEVCEAVQHAHDRGVIHRDLKPGNILVDHAGRPKVLDFGVARATNADIQMTTMHTGTGQLIGTLPYMSPEQVAGDPAAIDARCDVYALGVIGYELLSGRLPHDVRGRSIPDAARVISDEDPLTLGTVDRVYRGDIETIVGRALEKDKDRRYDTPGALADDIRRYLSDEPIVARPPSTLYQVRKFARRNKTLVGSLGVIMLVLAAAAIVSMVFAAQAIRARDVAERNETRAKRQAYIANIAAADSAMRDYDITAARRRLLAVDPEWRTPFEWRYLHARLDDSLYVLRHPDVARDPEAHLGGSAMGGGRHWLVYGVAVHPEGTLVAAGGTDHAVRIWSLDTGEIVSELTGHEDTVWSLDFSRDGALLASGAGDGTVRLWTTDGAAVRTIETGESVSSVRFGPNGVVLAAGCGDGALRLYEFESGAEQRRIEAHEKPVWGLAWAPDGLSIASTSEDGVTGLWDVATGARLHELRDADRRGTWVAFNHDGSVLAESRSGPAPPRLVDVTTWQPVGVLAGGTDTVSALEFTPDGRHAVTVSYDDTVRLVDLSSRLTTRVMLGHVGTIYQVAMDDAGQVIATTAGDGTVRVWARDIESVETIETRGMVNGLAWSPDGAMVASASAAGVVELWDGRTGLSVGTLTGHTQAVRSAAFFPDGKRIVTSSLDGTVRTWSATSHECEAVIAPEGLRFMDACLSPDGLRLATSTDDSVIRLWDVESHEVIAEMSGHDGHVYRVRFSDDGTVLASCGRDGTVRLWDVETRRERAVLEGHDGPVMALAIAPGGRVVSGGLDGTARVWEIGSPEPLLALRHPGPILSVAVTPDGQRLAAGTSSGGIHLWDVVTGEEVALLRGHSYGAPALSFSPDGNALVSGSVPDLRIWSTEPVGSRLRARADVMAAPNDDRRRRGNGGQPWRTR